MCDCVKTIFLYKTAAVISSRIILGIMLVHKMSYKELSDNRSMNAMLDANIKFRDKGPS